MSKQLEVIVVDDQSDLGESTARLVRLFGHHVSVFNSGRSVLAALDRVKPDLILSDIGMPDMDGCELAVRIKQRPDCANVVLAAVTGFADEEHQKAAAAAGFQYRFLKPLSPAVLQQFVDEIAGTYA